MSFRYCKEKGVFPKHKELTPFKNDPKQWNEKYWITIQVDYTKNPSVERMEHMKKVAKVYLAEKIKRLNKERLRN